MNMMSRDERKVRGIKRFKNSFGYSIDGLKYAFKNEQSLTIHVAVTVTIVLLATFLKISQIEWIICLFLIGLVLATELINTAFEAVVDLVVQDYHPLAKIAKDTASAAVFTFSMVAFIIGLLIFIPHIVGLFV